MLDKVRINSVKSIDRGKQGYCARLQKFRVQKWGQTVKFVYVTRRRQRRRVLYLWWAIFCAAGVSEAELKIQEYLKNTIYIYKIFVNKCVIKKRARPRE